MKPPRLFFRIAIVLVLGVSALFISTDGFTVYTTEGERRANIKKAPRKIPNLMLVDQEQKQLFLKDLEGKTLLIEFIYTSCPSYCYAMGSTYQRIDRHLKETSRNDVALISISFDYRRDKTKQITQYTNRFKAKSPSWYITRAHNQIELDNLLQNMGIMVIPDGSGGYEHNSAIHVIDQNGYLVDIVDFDKVELLTPYIGTLS